MLTSTATTPTMPPTAAAPAAAPPVADVTAGPPTLETGGVLTIDLAAIVNNWKALSRRVLPADCAAVVKADAYGCGIDTVASALATAGCRTFFVAHVAEAVAVRAVVPEAAIYVLNGIAPGGAAAFARINARPVIGSMTEFLEWDGFRAATGWRGDAALHFDTGMNRLGFAIEEASAFTPRVKKPDHGIALVMSHLACADTPEHPLNGRQIEAFRELRFQFRGIATSLANSSGIFLGPAAHCDVARPGAALFGINPTPATQNLMAPVVDLKARIIQLREVARGATIGYGAAHTTTKATRIAVVSVGYADGYLRANGGRSNDNPAKKPDRRAERPVAQAIIADRRCPIVGRISMDLMAFDVTGLPPEAVRRGSFATLIGDGISVDEVAAWGGTIGYEVLTHLGRRYHRMWKR